MDEYAYPRTRAALIRRLVAALRDLGLTAEPFGANLVWVVNRAADPPGDNPRANRMSPGLRQMVVCRPDEHRRLSWWWIWTAGAPGSGPEYELLAPATEVSVAAEKIARVLAVRPEIVS